MSAYTRASVTRGFSSLALFMVVLSGWSQPLIAPPAYPAAPAYPTTGQPFAVLSTTVGFRATYDANGSLLTRTVAGVTTTLAYNAENRVVRITQGLTGTGYAYDGDGTKVWEAQQVGATTPVTTVFLGAVEITLSPTARLTRTYYFIHGQRIALREQRSDGLVVYFLHGDALGSASLVTGLTGTVVSSLRYTPYGLPRGEAGRLPTPYRYTGQRETGVGFYDYQARLYDPAVGRFAQADTIVPNPFNPQLFNRYSYAKNNPVLYNDPDGHCGPLCIAGLILFLTGLTMIMPASNSLPPERAPSPEQGVIGLGLMTVGGTAVLAPGIATASGTAACLNDGDCTNEFTTSTETGARALEALSADGNPTNEAKAITSIVRRFTGTDMEALRDFSQRASQVQPQRGMKSFSDQWEMLGELAAQRPAVANNLFILDQSGIIGGAMRVREVSGQFWITHLEGLGGGAGTELVKAAIQESMARGYGGALHLISAPQSVSFYEKLGFTLVQMGVGGPEYILTAEAAQKLLGR